MTEQIDRGATASEIRMKSSVKGFLLRTAGSLLVGVLAALSIALFGTTGEILAALLLAAYIVPAVMRVVIYLDHLGDHADMNATIKAFKKREEAHRGDNVNPGGE